MTEPGISVLSGLLKLNSSQNQSQNKKNVEECYFTIAVSPFSTVKRITSFMVPKNLSTVDILKFWKTIKPVEKKMLDVVAEEFHIKSKK